MTVSEGSSSADPYNPPPVQDTAKPPDMSREDIRFLADVAAKTLSTTVSRYQRLNFSRRRGNAVRQHLESAGIIEAVAIATRNGQVVLYQLTEVGRSLCEQVGIDPLPRPRASLEHRYWIKKAHEYFQDQGYEVVREHPIKGDGAVDLLAERPGHRVAVEVETGKSDIEANLVKIRAADFDRVVFVATSPEAITACNLAMSKVPVECMGKVELLTWLDIA